MRSVRATYQWLIGTPYEETVFNLRSGQLVLMRDLFPEATGAQRGYASRILVKYDILAATNQRKVIVGKRPLHNPAGHKWRSKSSLWLVTDMVDRLRTYRDQRNSRSNSDESSN